MIVLDCAALLPAGKALLYWENQIETATVVALGTLWFFLIGWRGHSSVTILCYAALYVCPSLLKDSACKLAIAVGSLACGSANLWV